MVISRHTANPDPSARERIFFNTKVATQLVGFVDHIQTQYHEMIDGYVLWSTYFKNHQEKQVD
jgi:hypothetical protein